MGVPAISKADLGKITFVSIEVELNRISSERIVGLFLGYQPLTKTNTQIASSSENFLWLAKGDQLHIVSLSHYKVNTIRIGLGVASSQVICTSAWAADAVIEEITTIRNSLIERKWGDSDGLIETYHYTDIPKALKEDIEGKTPASSFNSQAVTPATGSHATGYNNNSYVYKKKEVNTSAMKRTTRYDVAEAIEALRKKIQEIRDGKYEAPKLKTIPADKSKDDDEKKQTTTKETPGTGGLIGDTSNGEEDELYYPYG